MKSVNHFLIPDLCRNSRAFSILMVTELVVMVITLLGDNKELVNKLGLTSFYCIWLVTLTLLALCYLRRWVAKRSFFQGWLAVLAVCLFVFTLVETISQWFMLGNIEMSMNWTRFSRHGLAVLIISLMSIRVMALMSTFERRNKADIQSRMQALQSRIQPHFLFNSLNTISELSATSAEQAEKAIQALSLLFRASLESVNKMHSLQAELDLCQRYLELEQWRLGDNLKVTHTLSVKELKTWFVPKLILQPLIENAVKHGAALTAEVQIKIDVKETDKFLSILVENPVYSNRKESKGNGMAIANIKERLFVLYDDQQSFKVRDDGKHFQVIIRLPKQTQAKALNAG